MAKRARTASWRWTPSTSQGDSRFLVLSVLSIRRIRAWIQPADCPLTLPIGHSPEEQRSVGRRNTPAWRPDTPGKSAMGVGCSGRCNFRECMAKYASNQALTVPTAGTAGKINSATVAASLERNLGKSLGLRVGYEHDFQEQIGVSDPNLQGTAHRNRFSVTLGYQWARPLGR